MAVDVPGELNLDEAAWGSGSDDFYEDIEQIGEETDGQVYMAREIATGEVVALKVRMDNEKEGFPITPIRETKTLKKLQHANVIKLKEIATSKEALKAEDANANANIIDAFVQSPVMIAQAPVLAALDVNTPIDGTSNRKRAVQHVSTRATRKAVVRWMIEDEAVNGKKLLISRAVKAFPEHFFGADKSNLQKASCWWKRREEILEDDDEEHDPEVTCRVRVSSRGSLKARAGRGRKRAARIIRAPVLGVLDAKRARRGRVTNHGSKNGKRALQHVSTMATRKAVVSWMIEDEALHGEKCLISRTVKAFPEHFCGNDKANLAKVSRWWKARDEILQDEEEEDDPDVEQSLVLVSNRPQVRLKARAGRGRKRAAWVNWLHTQLLEETDRLRKTGVKVSPKLLQEIACHILRMSNADFTEKTVDPKDGVPIVQKITPQWIQGFMNRTKAMKTPKDKMAADS